MSDANVKRLTRYNATASMGVEAMGNHGFVNRPQIAYLQKGGAIEAETVHLEPVCMAKDVASLEDEYHEEVERRTDTARRLLRIAEGTSCRKTEVALQMLSAALISPPISPEVRARMDAMREAALAKAEGREES